MANTLDTFTAATAIGDTDLLHIKVGTGANSDKKITGANAKLAFLPEGTAVKSTGETGGTKFLREDGDGTCSWQSSGSAMTLIGSATVAGSEAQTLALGSLSLSSYKAFKVVAKIKAGSGGGSNVSLYYNADTTATNYHRITSVGTTTYTLSRANDGIIFSVGAGELIDAHIDVTLDVDGAARARGYSCEGVTSGITLRDFVHLWITAANVTTITFSSSAANGFAVGTTFSVFGMV